MKKVLLFNGSPHPRGNTAMALDLVEAELKAAGIATERIQVGGRLLHGCLGCRKCWELKNRRCAIDSDPVNGWIEKMLEAGGFVMGSPVYTANITSELKALIDRAGFVAKANGFAFKGKVGAPVVVGTKAGMMPAYQAIQSMFGISQMISVGSIHWHLADILKDAKGVDTMQVLGRNLAELLRRLGEET